MVGVLVFFPYTVCLSMCIDCGSMVLIHFLSVRMADFTSPVQQWMLAEIQQLTVS